MQNNLSDDAFFYMCVLDGSGGCQDLNKNELANWKSEKGVLWLDLNYSHHTTQNWLRKKSGLEDIICEALLAEETRPRVVQYGKGLLIVLRGVNLNPGATPDDMVSIRIWTDENKIISTRLRHLLSIADMRELLEDHKGPVNSAEFIVELSRRLVWRMSDTIDNMEDLIAELEDKVLTAESAELRFDLSLLRRQIITLRRYLAPQRDALSRLNLQTVSWFGENNRIEIREIGDRLTRHIEDLDAVRERAAVTQEELLSRLSEHLNNRIYILSLIAAIFLPLGFLTGLLGVNIGGIPGADNPWAFSIFIVILFIIVGFQIWLFRLKKWF